jgi:hypothetical protein
MKIKLEFRTLTTHVFEIDPEFHMGVDPNNAKELIELVNSLREASPSEIINRDKVQPIDEYEEYTLKEWDVIK